MRFLLFSILYFFSSTAAAYAQYEVFAKHLWTLVGKEPTRRGVGFTVKVIDDVNDDGFNDFMIGNPSLGTVQIYDGQHFSKLRTFIRNKKSDFGHTLLPMGDIFVFGVPIKKGVPTEKGAPAKRDDDTGSVLIYRPQVNGSYRWEEIKIRNGFLLHSYEAFAKPYEARTYVIEHPDFQETFTLGRGLARIGDTFLATSPSFKDGTGYVFNARNSNFLYRIEDTANMEDLEWERYDQVCENRWERKGYTAWSTPDLDGDGTLDVAIGAEGQHPAITRGENPEYPCPGRIYFHSGKTGKLLTVLEGKDPSSHLGMSFSFDDMNGDGQFDFLVGTPYENCEKETIRCGAIYVIDGTQILPLDQPPKIHKIDPKKTWVLDFLQGEKKNELLGFQVAFWTGPNDELKLIFSVPGHGHGNRGQIRIHQLKKREPISIIDGPQDGLWFAHTLEIDPAENRMYVGSPYYHVQGALFIGRVDVYALELQSN